MHVYTICNLSQDLIMKDYTASRVSGFAKDCSRALFAPLNNFSKIMLSLLKLPNLRRLSALGSISVSSLNTSSYVPISGGRTAPFYLNRLAAVETFSTIETS